MIVQHMYHDMSFDSPFLVVYIGTSLFTIFLPSRWVYEKWGPIFHKLLRVGCCGGDDNNNNNSHNNTDDDVDAVVIIPWRNNHDRSRSSYNDQEVFTEDAEFMPMSRGEEEEDVDTTISSNRHNSSTSTLEIRPPSPLYTAQLQLLSHIDHIYMASKIAPLWFISNYSYAISLHWTTIASSTVLASMGSIFAFLFATCTRYGDERLTRGKVVGVTLCFMGGVATAWADVGGGSLLSSSVVDNRENNNENRILLHRLLQHSADLANSNSSIRWTLVGDVAGLLSAMGYGAYTVLLRHVCPKDENRMSMQLLFGYVGLLNMMALFPVALWLILTPNHDRQSSEEEDEENNNSGQHAATTLTWTIFLYLIGMGLVDNVISDYLWARAVILTSATVASVGLGLTIPMAFLADKVMGSNSQTHLGDVIGALCVLSGFVFVNIREEEMVFSRINSLPENNRTSVDEEKEEEDTQF